MTLYNKSPNKLLTKLFPETTLVPGKPASAQNNKCNESVVLMNYK